MPSSSAHCVTGSTKSASAAVSEKKKSHTTSRSSASRPARTCETSGADTTTFDPCTSRQRTGPPSSFSSSIAGTTGSGKRFRVDAPHAGDVRASGRVGDLAVAGQLVALLAVLATALAVALPGERAVSRAGDPDEPQDEREVDRRGRGVGAVDVLLDAATGEDERAATRGADGERPRATARLARP